MHLEAALLLNPGAQLQLCGECCTLGVVIRASDDEDTWLEWRVDGLAIGERWLSIEKDARGQASVGLWQRTRGTAPQPFPDVLAHGAASLPLAERGEARYWASGSAAIPASGRLEFAVYKRPGEQIAFERFEREGKWWIGTGAPLEPRAVTLHSSSP